MEGLCRVAFTHSDPNKSQVAPSKLLLRMHIKSPSALMLNCLRCRICVQMLILFHAYCIVPNNSTPRLVTHLGY